MNDPQTSAGAGYESTTMLDEYLLFHFGSEDEILPPGRHWPTGMREALDFPVRTVSHFGAEVVSSGLDLGCAVGRSTWEMARSCELVTGVDFSHSFIAAARQLQNQETIPYQRREEAHQSTRLLARAPQGISPASVRFEQGDAMALRRDLGAFHRVHAANLLCRLNDPKRLLERLPELVLTGGELVLATPCTWLDSYTPPSRWPRPDTFTWLMEELAPHFELVHRSEEPFLIRETARKFQWTSSMLTVWRRL